MNEEPVAKDVRTGLGLSSKVSQAGLSFKGYLKACQCEGSYKQGFTPRFLCFSVAVSLIVSLLLTHAVPFTVSLCTIQLPTIAAYSRRVYLPLTCPLVETRLHLVMSHLEF